MKNITFGGGGGRVHWKIRFLRGGGYNYLKRGSLAVYKFKVGGGTWPEKGGGVFLGGWYPNAHYGMTAIFIST